MAGRKLQRDPDTQIGGVCHGLANHLDADVGTVRVVALLLWFFTSAPMVMLYVVAWLFLPQGRAADVADEVDVVWDPDRLRVRYPGGLVSQVEPSRFDLGLIWRALVAVAVGLTLATLVLWGLPNLGVELPPVIGAVGAVVGALRDGLIPLIALAAVFLRWPVQHTISVDHTTLVVERPLRGVRRVDLSEVEAVEVESERLRVRLVSGEELPLPLPRDPIAVEALQQQVLAGAPRALAHQEDLEQAVDRRAELERLMGSRALDETR